MMETAAQMGVEGRIINVSSVIHNWVRRDGFQFYNMLNPKNYSGTQAYAQSKLANILHAKELARRIKEHLTFLWVEHHSGQYKSQFRCLQKLGREVMIE
ncbi:hypothetical protein QJS10_CPA03g00344 [Acorus calamus]|uniref:Uncharacterized protein n=1 Tax=Acorus calamus TaxID=4465 RepID=A0AAV9F327_ACOCL|nr:hypothetical protein QJS10_CPA03g00351 [Acorus calamus]KAK1321934.1 hypothetical protein QJS10_CPA03g00344 [Acorus calamus]